MLLCLRLIDQLIQTYANCLTLYLKMSLAKSHVYLSKKRQTQYRIGYISTCVPTIIISGFQPKKFTHW